jgi:hypothetical protein
LIKAKAIESAELKTILEKYIKSKLPTHLMQKNACLFAPASNDSETEVLSKSLDIKRRLSDDELIPENVFYSNS